MRPKWIIAEVSASGGEIGWWGTAEGDDLPEALNAYFSDEKEGVSYNEAHDRRLNAGETVRFAVGRQQGPRADWHPHVSLPVTVFYDVARSGVSIKRVGT